MEMTFMFNNMDRCLSIHMQSFTDIVNILSMIQESIFCVLGVIIAIYVMVQCERELFLVTATKTISRSSYTNQTNISESEDEEDTESSDSSESAEDEL